MNNDVFISTTIVDGAIANVLVFDNSKDAIAHADKCVNEYFMYDGDDVSQVAVFKQDSDGIIEKMYERLPDAEDWYEEDEDYDNA